jgi:hypothetical protein
MKDEQGDLNGNANAPTALFKKPLLYQLLH